MGQLRRDARASSSESPGRGFRNVPRAREGKAAAGRPASLKALGQNRHFDKTNSHGIDLHLFPS